MHRLGWLALVALVGCGGSNSGSNSGGDAAQDVDGAITPDGHDGGGGDDGGTPDGQSTCAAAERCDGVVDDDCDGVVDEDCGRCPLLAIACPTGCCPVDRWEVAQQAATGTAIDVDDAGNIYFAYTLPSGGPWTTAISIYDAEPGTWRTTPLGGGTYRTRVKVDAQGRVHVLYGTSGGALYYGRSDDHGMTFSSTLIGTLNIGGMFDLALDSTGAPHVAYAGDAQYTSFSDLRYAHIGPSGWTTEIVDADSHSCDYPDIELGFADRPHIVYDAYLPPGVDATTKRYAFDNGNRWVFENLDTQTAGHQFTGDTYFSSHVLRVAADDSRELLYTRHDGDADVLVLAKRGPLDADAWQETAITGASDFETPSLFVEADGAHGAVSDGLRVHRESAGAAWTSAALGVPGTHVSTARRGSHLYVGYVSDNDHPAVTVVDLE